MIFGFVINDPKNFQILIFMKICYMRFLYNNYFKDPEPLLTRESGRERAEPLVRHSPVEHRKWYIAVQTRDTAAAGGPENCSVDILRAGVSGKERVRS